MAKPLLKIPTNPVKTKSQQIDDLASDALQTLNKKFKDTPSAFQFLSDANMITDWVSTGSDILDLAVSNRPNGGLGYSSFVEISGLPGSGKSLLAAHILANTQKQGGIAVLFDTEKAIGMLDYYEAVGLDTHKTLYTDKIRALEDIFASIENLVIKYIDSGETRKMTIVIDSIMGATTNAELESTYAKDGFATTKAIVLSKACRKLPSLVVGRNILIVFVNQLKENINAIGFGVDPYKTTGGTAIPFTSHVRLRTKVVKTLAVDKVECGSRIEVKVTKNRFGPKGRRVSLDVYYDSGIDNYGSWLQCLKDFGIVKQAGAYYTYDFELNGEKVRKQFQSKDFKRLMDENPDLKAELYEKICEQYIMKYRVNDDFGIDDVHEVDDDE